MADVEHGLDRARRLARAFSTRVRTRFGDRVRAVTLYGSAARGDWTPESDVDVLILLDQVSPKDSDWIVRQAFSMGMMKEGLLLQPVFMPAGQFAEIRARERRFALEIEREGIVL